MIHDEWRGGYKHFTIREMTCRCGCGGLPRHSFMLLLGKMRNLAGFPLSVSSGYRCPEYNQEVSRTGLTGPHTFGLAADIAIFGVPALEAIAYAFEVGMTGIGVNQKGQRHERFLHVDCLNNSPEHPRPWIWSY